MDSIRAWHRRTPRSKKDVIRIHQYFVHLLYILVERLGLTGVGVALSSRAVVLLLGQLWPTLHLLGQEGVLASINTPPGRRSSVTIR